MPGPSPVPAESVPAAPADPVVSVVIPTYARADYLSEAVASALRQDVLVEVVIVDDASPVPVADHPDPRVRVIRLDNNGGPGSARNAGAGAARGEYIVFCDDDDVLAAHIFAQALKVAGPRMVVVWQAAFIGSTGSGSAAEQRPFTGDLSRTIISGPFPHPGQVLIRRGDLVPFDEHLRTTEDLEWWVRQAAGMTFAEVAAVGYRRRNHDGVRHRVTHGVRYHNRLRVLRMHGAYFDTNRAARAMQQQRIGQSALLIGRPRLAAYRFTLSLVAAPTRFRLRLLARAFVDLARVPAALLTRVRRTRRDA